MKVINAIGAAKGVVKVPPSKSYTARALLLAAATEGSTTVLNPLDSDDSRYMLDALRKVGYETSGNFADGLVIGERLSISANEIPISVGNAGTAMRFLTGFLAFTPGRFLLGGDSRMHERPISDLVDALLTVDGEIEYAEREGYPPLRIRGKKTRGGFEIPVSGEVSSQFVSSLLMAGATLPGGVRIRVDSLSSQPYIDMTVDILRKFGAEVEQLEPSLFRVKASTLLRDEYTVEGDYSSASYWFAAAAVTRGSVTVRGLVRDSVQGDRKFLDLLTAIGCQVEWEGDQVTVSASEQLRGGTFDCNAMPDIVPTLAAIAPAASEPVIITNVANLRVKESDRISVLASELRKLGATVEESADGLAIQPGWNDQPAVIDPHEDHRIAMSFAIAGLQRGNVSIEKEQVVSKSYPRFWRTLEEVVRSSSQ